MITLPNPCLCPNGCRDDRAVLHDDGTTLFLAAQHLGEYGSIRKDMASETRQYAMKTINGQEFMQTREMPIGSNWPDKTANAPAKSAVVAVCRIDGSSLAWAQAA